MRIFLAVPIRIIGLLLFATVLLPSGYGQTIEAENGRLQGTVIATERTGFSGSGYVTGFDDDGDRVTMQVTAQAGVYELYVRYAAPSGDKFNFIYVNDVNLGSVAFPMSATFAEIKVGKVYLRAGENTVSIVKEWGFFDIDNIRLQPSDPSDIYNVAPHPVNENVSHRTDSLYNFLVSIYGKVILSGQYGGTQELKRIRDLSGKTPVVLGLDLIDYTPSRVERGTKSTVVEEAIGWDREGGMVTLCWHWNAPMGLIDQPGKEWWRGFYTEATTFDVTRAMKDPQSEEYQLILRDFDAIAVQLKRLQAANVPLLWRPLHEAEGRWFWWGAKGPEPCIWLWRLLYDRVVNHHRINNLIWVWTSTDKPSAIDWYPGDDYVDMIGADIYLPSGTQSSSFITFDNIAAIYGGKKLIALSENGPMPDPETMFAEGAAWSWFATWEGQFIMDGKSNTAPYVKEVYTHDYVVTLEEIGDIESIIVALEEKRAKAPDDTMVVNIGEGVPPVVIYHNPVRDNQFSLTMKNIRMDSQVRIYDMQGRMVAAAESKEREIQQYDFNFSSYKNGIYLVRIVTPEFTRIVRVIKM